MNITHAIEIVERMLENPVSTWLDYTPKYVPMVLDDGAGIVKAALAKEIGICALTRMPAAEIMNLFHSL